MIRVYDAAGNTDPVCTLSPNRARVDAVLRDMNLSVVATWDWMLRVNPTKEAATPLDWGEVLS